MNIVELEIEEVYPSLTFYYGMSYRELIELPRWVLMMYLKALPGLLAEQEMAMARAASLPYLKNRSSQRGYMRDLRKVASQKREQKVAPKLETPSAADLGAMGIGIRGG